MQAGTDVSVDLHSCICPREITIPQKNIYKHYLHSIEQLECEQFVAWILITVRFLREISNQLFITSGILYGR
jgi:hypothetical protein